MARFVPVARYVNLPELPFGGSISPVKIIERNPRRHTAYFENFSTQAEILITGDLTPLESGANLGRGAASVHLPRDFAITGRELNPLLLHYSGLVAAARNQNIGGTDLSTAELIDDVDHPGQDSIRFRAQFFHEDLLVSQPGPLFQPIKVYEPAGAIRFLHMTASLGNVVLTMTATPVTVSQSFRLPQFFPLYFRYPFIPSRAIFAAEISGGGGRLHVVTGLA